MDPFDDIFSDSSAANAPAINKFQPKAKPRPRKTAFKPGPTICSDSKKKVVAQASYELHAGKNVRLVDVADKIPDSPVLPSSALEDTSIDGKSLERDKDTSLGAQPMKANKNSQPIDYLLQHGDSFSGADVPVFDKSQSLDVLYADGTLSQVDMTEGNCDPVSKKSVVEGADVCSGFELESLDDFINPSTSATSSNHLHNVGMNIYPGSKSSSPVINDGESGSFTPLETQTCNVLGNTDAQRASRGYTSEDQAFETDCLAEDHVICSGATVSNQNRESEIENQKSQTELSEIGVGDFDIVDMMPGVTVSSGSRVRKYKPRPKVQSEKIKVSTEIPSTNTISASMCSQASQLGSCGSGLMNCGSGHADQPDGGSLPKDYSFDSCLNENRVNSKETSPSQVPSSDDVLPSPAVSKKNTKSRKRSSEVSNHSQEPIESSLPREGNGGVKPRKREKKSVGAASPEFGPEERNCYSGLSDDEDTAYSNGIEDEIRKDDDEYKGESTSKKKRAPKKGKKSESSENPGQKCNRASSAPKKFPHATQRKRRCVDKNLLDTPEDEIDYRNLRIKDLIILAEVRERLASKASRSDAPPTNQSVDGNDHDEYLGNEDGLSSEQGHDFSDDQDTIRAQPIPLLNYHSFMDRPRTARWTKQETELFYEGVRQFGSDLSLIKQLFPDRDRNQVKQKYKHEERKNRLRLHETLASRPKDYTHFKKLIEQLQQATAKVEQDANGDHSMGKSDADAEELIPEADVEATKSTQDEDVIVKDDVPNVNSPVEAEGADNDDDIWSSYQSIY